MQLGYVTNGLQNHRLDDALRLLADEGYEAVGITPDTCHLDPFRTSAKELDAIAALLQRLRLQPVMETGARFLLDPRRKHEPTLMTRDLAARQRRLDFYTAVARIGAVLGARVVSFWSGIDRQPGSDSAAWLRDGVRRACELIRAAKLEPSLEPEPGMALETVAQWHALRSDLGADAPRLTLDVGHLYAVWEGEPASVIAAAAPFLSQVHLEDMVLGHHEHLPPGNGNVDFSSVSTALLAIGYSGPACFELARNSHDAPTQVRACRALWTALGHPAPLTRPVTPLS